MDDQDHIVAACGAALELIRLQPMSGEEVSAR